MRKVLITLAVWLSLAVPAWATCTAGSDTYSQEICTLSPTTYYRLNDSTSSAVDSSGNGNTGTYAGVAGTAYTQSVTGPFTSGSACTTLKTSSGYITGPNVTGAVSRTLLITVKLANASTAGNLIGIGNAGTGYSIGFGDTLGSTNWATNGTELIGLYPSVAWQSYHQHPAVTPAMFGMVALVVDASSHDTLYYDGTQYIPSSVGVDLTSTGVLTIGSAFGGQSNAMVGTVCDAAVFSSALSGANIATLWADFLASRTQQSSANNYQKAILQDDPAAAWPLNETSGTSAADITGFGGTGTYENTPTLNQAGPVAGIPSATFAAASLQYMLFPVLSMQMDAGTQECWVNIGGAAQSAGIFNNGIDVSGQTALSFGIGPITGNGSATTDLAGRAFGGTAQFNTLGSTWHLVDFTGDGAVSPTITMYMDATSQGTVNAIDAPAGRIATSSALMNWSDGGSSRGSAASAGHLSYASGSISNCAEYPYVLTQAQITAHYAAMTAAGATGGWFAP